MSRSSLEHTVEIERPVEQVFDFIADPQNDPRWCPRVSDCRQLEGRGPGQDARYEVDHHPSLQRPHARLISILQFEPPRRLLTEQSDRVALFRIRYELTPTGSGTRLTQHDEIDWRILPPFRPIGKRIVQRHMGEQLRSLKRLLEDG
jgi:uncharacterized protein YndB with AHSA1/START domain